MKITPRDIEKLAGVLRTIGSSTSPFLVYFVAINGRHIEPVLKSLASSRGVVDGYPAYADEHRALCEAHAHKDENGLARSTQHKTDQGVQTAYSIKDPAEYGVAYAELQAKHADVLKAHEEHQAGRAEFETTEVELPLISIKMSQCGAGIITGDLAMFLMSRGLLEWDIEQLGGNRHLEAVKE